MSTTTPKNSQLTSDTSLLAGIEQNSASLPPLVLGGKTYTPADCASVMQARVNAGKAAVTAKGVAAKAVQDNRNEIALTKTFVSQLRTAILLAFGRAGGAKGADEQGTGPQGGPQGLDEAAARQLCELSGGGARLSAERARGRSMRQRGTEGGAR
jgi:hypothetical protein